MLKTLTLVVTGLLVASCEGQADKRMTEVAATKLPPSSRSEAFAACRKAIDAADWNTAATCYTPDAVLSLVDAGVTHVGPQAIIDAFYKPFHDAFPDLRPEPQITFVKE